MEIGYNIIIIITTTTIQNIQWKLHYRQMAGNQFVLSRERNVYKYNRTTMRVSVFILQTQHETPIIY